MFSFQILYQLQQMVSLWKSIPPRRVKRPIQILPKQTSPIIPCYNTIRVHHRDDISDKLFPELFGFGLGAAYILYEPLTNEWTIRLTRMHSSRNYHYLLIIIFHLLISDLQYRHPQPTQAFQRRQHLTILHRGQELQQPRIWIGNKISKLNSVIRNIKAVSKTQGNVPFQSVYF